MLTKLSDSDFQPGHPLRKVYEKREAERSAAQSTEEDTFAFVEWEDERLARRAKRPLILHSSSIVYISVLSPEIDVYPLLTWSGLMDCFDSFGLTAHVKGSVCGSSLSLCIDRNICPRPQQFEVVITEERAALIAADQTGLLYSVYAFI